MIGYYWILLEYAIPHWIYIVYKYNIAGFCGIPNTVQLEFMVDNGWQWDITLGSLS